MGVDATLGSTDRGERVFAPHRKSGPVILLKTMLVGRPITKKNSQRMCRRGKKIFPMPSAQHETWSKPARLQLRLAWAARLAHAGPVQLVARFYTKGPQGDLVNYLQALCDALQGACVIVDDKQIVSFDGSRLRKDKLRPRIEFELHTFDEPID